MNNAKFEFYMLESIKDMIIYENEDILPIISDDIDNNIDLIIEKLIPYLELNMSEVNIALLEADILQTMRDNARENLKNYKKMILSKVSPARFKEMILQAHEKLIKRPLTNVKDAIALGLLTAKLGLKKEAAKRLEYASQNLQRAADKIKSK